MAGKTNIPDRVVAQLPVVEQGQFPPYVRTDEEKLRFRLAVGVAMKTFDLPQHEPTVWLAARTIYRSGIPT